MIYHVIAYSLLTLTLIRMSYYNFKKSKAIDRLLYYNEEIITRFNEVFDELVKTNEELQLTKSAKDMYWEDRNSLIENIKGLIPKNIN